MTNQIKEFKILPTGSDTNQRNFQGIPKGTTSVILINCDNVGNMSGIEVVMPTLEQLYIESHNFIISHSLDSVAGIEHCQRLTDLTLTWVRNVDLSPINSMPWLRKLNLSHGDLNSFLDLSRFEQLEVVHFPYCGITQVNSQLLPPKVKELDIGKNNIRDFPDFSKALFLEKLLIGDNFVRNLSSARLPPNAQFLSLDNDDLYEFPDLSGLKQLRKVFMWQNHIRKNVQARLMPPNVNILHLGAISFGILPMLSQLPMTRLFMQNDDLEKLEMDLLPSSLQVFQLDSNNIKEFPDMRRCEAMTSLFILRLRIEKVQDGFLPPNLKELQIRNTTLKEVPNFSCAKNIERLEISYSCIDDSEQVFKLRDLSKVKQLLCFRNDWDNSNAQKRLAAILPNCIQRVELIEKSNVADQIKQKFSEQRPKIMELFPRYRQQLVAEAQQKPVQQPQQEQANDDTLSLSAIQAHWEDKIDQCFKGSQKTKQTQVTSQQNNSISQQQTKQESDVSHKEVPSLSEIYCEFTNNLTNQGKAPISTINNQQQFSQQQVQQVPVQNNQDAKPKQQVEKTNQAQLTSQQNNFIPTAQVNQESNTNSKQQPCLDAVLLQYSNNLMNQGKTPIQVNNNQQQTQQQQVQQVQIQNNQSNKSRYDVFTAFPQLQMCYQNRDRVKADVDLFLQQNVSYKVALGTMANKSVIALTGESIYFYQNTVCKVNLVFYLDYNYPNKQPSLLIIPANDSAIKPDNACIQLSGTFSDMPNWNEKCNIVLRLQHALTYFCQWPPTQPKATVAQQISQQQGISPAIVNKQQTMNQMGPQMIPQTQNLTQFDKNAYPINSSINAMQPMLPGYFTTNVVTIPQEPQQFDSIQFPQFPQFFQIPQTQPIIQQSVTNQVENKPNQQQITLYEKKQRVEQINDAVPSQQNQGVSQSQQDFTQRPTQNLQIQTPSQKLNNAPQELMQQQQNLTTINAQPVNAVQETQQSQPIKKDVTILKYSLKKLGEGDEVMNGNVATYTGGPAKVGIQFNGCCHLETKQIISAKEVSFSFYLNPSSTQMSNCRVFSNKAIEFRQFRNNCNAYCVYSGTQNNKGWDLSNSVQIESNKFTHITVTISQVEAKIYVDGDQVKKFSRENEQFQSSNPLCIGANVDGEGYFAGFVEDFRLYEGLLTQDEIKEIINPQLAPLPSQTANANPFDFKQSDVFQGTNELYTNFKVLSQTGLSKVYSITAIQSGDQIVMKVANLQNQAQIEYYNREVKLLKMGHEKIIPLRDAFIQNNVGFIVMEKAMRILEKFSNSISKEELYNIFQDVVDGLIFLHNQSIVHRDVKPENIMILNQEPWVAVLIDFNVCAFGSNNSFSTVNVGTPGFMAPEINKGDKYDDRCDTFSLGKTIQEIIKMFKIEGVYKDLEMLAQRMANDNPQLRPKLTHFRAFLMYKMQADKVESDFKM